MVLASGSMLVIKSVVEGLGLVLENVLIGGDVLLSRLIVEDPG